MCGFLFFIFIFCSVDWRIIYSVSVYPLWYSFCTLILLCKFSWTFHQLNGCFPKDTFRKSKFLSFNIVHGNAHWKSELALPSNLSFLWAGLYACRMCELLGWSIIPRTYLLVSACCQQCPVYFLITVCCQ